jgi:nitrite reductase (NO-forming)
MKIKILISAIVTLLFIACSNKKTEETTTTAEPPQSMVEEPHTSTSTGGAGEATYQKVCIACHQADGKGIPNAFPPLAASDYLNGDVNKSISAVVHGLNGEITVNGAKFNGTMTPQPLNDQEVADVLTYVYSQWDNNGTVVTPDMVAKIRAEK